MAEKKLNILQVSKVASEGGAGRVAWELFKAYREQGHNSWLALGTKQTDDPGVQTMPHHLTRRPWAGFWWRFRRRLESQAGGRGLVRSLYKLSRGIAEPGSRLDKFAGREDFRYPGAWHLLECTQPAPDVVQCHNLHEGYFDLRALPMLSKQTAVVLNLHDAWLLSGHCAHSFDCERWKTGCGQCPDLTIDPPIQRDATHFNWERKRNIFAQSRLHITTACEWLMRKVQQSNLASGVVEARVIPNGITLDVFCPGDRAAARARLGLPAEGPVVLFTSDSLYGHTWKDAPMLRRTLEIYAPLFQRHGVHLLCLGNERPEQNLGFSNMRFIPFSSDPRRVPGALQAADIYLHPARADTFPTLVLEAQACGCPVIATRVGGIPEQIEDGVTGFLASPGNAEEMARLLSEALGNGPLRRRMAEAAAQHARQCYDLNRAVNAYLDWFQELKVR